MWPMNTLLFLSLCLEVTIRCQGQGYNNLFDSSVSVHDGYFYFAPGEEKVNRSLADDRCKSMNATLTSLFVNEAETQFLFDLVDTSSNIFIVDVFALKNGNVQWFSTSYDDASEQVGVEVTLITRNCTNIADDALKKRELNSAVFPYFSIFGGNKCAQIAAYQAANFICKTAIQNPTIYGGRGWAPDTTKTPYLSSTAVVIDRTDSNLNQTSDATTEFQGIQNITEYFIINGVKPIGPTTSPTASSSSATLVIVLVLALVVVAVIAILAVILIKRRRRGKSRGMEPPILTVKQIGERNDYSASPENATLMRGEDRSHHPVISAPTIIGTTFDGEIDFIPLAPPASKENSLREPRPSYSYEPSSPVLTSFSPDWRSDINRNATLTNNSDNVYAEPIINKPQSSDPRISSDDDPEQTYDQLDESKMNNGDDELKMIVNELYHHGELAANQSNDENANRYLGYPYPTQPADDELVMEENELYGRGYYDEDEENDKP